MLVMRMVVYQIPIVLPIMSDEIEKARILQLREELHAHNYNYYVKNAPVISDQDFDHLMHELAALEARHPEPGRSQFTYGTCRF